MRILAIFLLLAQPAFAALQYEVYDDFNGNSLDLIKWQPNQPQGFSIINGDMNIATNTTTCNKWSYTWPNTTLSQEGCVSSVQFIKNSEIPFGIKIGFDIDQINSNFDINNVSFQGGIDLLIIDGDSNRWKLNYTIGRDNSGYSIAFDMYKEETSYRPVAWEQRSTRISNTEFYNVANIGLEIYKDFNGKIIFNGYLNNSPVSFNDSFNNALDQSLPNFRTQQLRLDWGTIVSDFWVSLPATVNLNNLNSVVKINSVDVAKSAPIGGCNITQTTVDQAKANGISEGKQACVANPASCGISSGFTQANLDQAKANGISEGKQGCVANPAGCGIYSGFTQANLDQAKANGISEGKQGCVANPAGCGISTGFTQAQVDLKISEATVPIQAKLNTAQADLTSCLAQNGTNEASLKTALDNAYQQGHRAGSKTCANSGATTEAVQISGGGFYSPGNTVKVQLTETIDVASFEQVDLWVIIQLPSGTLLYMTDNPFTQFAGIPAPFKRSLQRSNNTHQILSFEVPPGMGGDYIFYSFFVKEGADMTNLFLDLKSNVATTKVTLRNQ